jgi:hypothetical protein
MMLLRVLTGEDTVLLEAYEFRALLARDEAEELRRKLVRRLLGEKRAVMAWNRDDCMVGGMVVGREDRSIGLLRYQGVLQLHWCVVVALGRRRTCPRSE